VGGSMDDAHSKACDMLWPCVSQKANRYKAEKRRMPVSVLGVRCVTCVQLFFDMRRSHIHSTAG
jgi:hypothetical protein